MLAEIIFALFLGILLGTFTGLTPGIHINLVATIILSLSIGILSNINPIFLVIFITSMSISHTFIDFIPSIYLGCPDTDTELSILPGHELLKEGKGHEAVLLSNNGSLLAMLLITILSFPFILLVSETYPTIETLLPYLLILSSIFLIYLENDKPKAITVFFLSGILGILVFNLETKQPLLPLLTGLFGSSNLILSLKNKPKIPSQIISKPKEKLLKPMLGAIIASPICSFLPGLGSGQAAIIGNTISKTDRKGFIVLLGATNTIVMSISFLTLYLISKTRTGSASAIKDLIGVPEGKIIFLIILTALLSGIVSYKLTEKISEAFSQKISKINYYKISLFTLIILFAIILTFSGIIGTIIFFASTTIGIYSISLGVRRTNMMGCLLIPTIILYLF